MPPRQVQRLGSPARSREVVFASIFEGRPTITSFLFFDSHVTFFGFGKGLENAVSASLKKNAFEQIAKESHEIFEFGFSGDFAFLPVRKQNLHRPVLERQKCFLPMPALKQVFVDK